MRRTPHLAVLLTLALAGLARAEPRAAAVLAVSDAGIPGADVTETIGSALFRRFFERAPYDRLIVLSGGGAADPQLQAAVRKAVASYEVVDVFCWIHTTPRDPASWRGVGAGRLRLVYSTACHGEQAERAAWEAAGARTVITHVGLNDGLAAFPYVLSRWLGGATIGDAACEAYREVVLTHHLAASLQGGFQELIGRPSAPADADPSGCRPAISGDPDLTILSGLPNARSVLPGELVYSRQRGGLPGLLLRGLAGGIRLGRGEVAGLLDRAYVTSFVPAEALRDLEVVTAGGAGSADLTLSEAVTLPVPGLPLGFELRVARDVSVQPGVVDVDRRRIEVRVRGLSLVRGALRVRLRGATLTSDDEGQHRLRLSAGLWGFIPVWKTLRASETPAPPIAELTPLLLEPAATPGLTGALEEVER
jgi:hypothetical protein